MSETPAEAQPRSTAGVLEAREVLRAERRIAGATEKTPEVEFRVAELDVVVKCECVQKTGAFKARGALNAVRALQEERGLTADDADAVASWSVVTHSSGNHGAALAWAAREAGVECYVAVPHGAPTAKLENIAAHGGRIDMCEATVAARQAAATALAAKYHGEFVHPSEDVRVIHGQGTAALELLRSAEAAGRPIATLLAPVGGGGLISGTALAVEALYGAGGEFAAAGATRRPRVIGVEPAGADDAVRSLRADTLLPCEAPRTIADGLRSQLGPNTWSVVRNRALVHDVIVVDETHILEAVHLLHRDCNLTVEPSGAVPLAGLLQHAERARTEHWGRIGLILSGGNIDAAVLARCLSTDLADNLALRLEPAPSV